MEKERKRIAYEAKLADLEKEQEEEKQGNKIQNGNGNLIFIFLSFCPSHIMSKSASKLKKYLDLPYKKMSCWQLTITKLKKFTFWGFKLPYKTMVMSYFFISTIDFMISISYYLCKPWGWIVCYIYLNYLNNLSVIPMSIWCWAIVYDAGPTPN